MISAKELFNKNIDDLSILTTIYDYLSNNGVSLDTTELLRAEYVLCVSALDHYIHHRVRDGLINIFNSGTHDMGAVRISLKVVKLMMNENNIEERTKILDAELKNILSKDSYQSPSSIEAAFSLIDINKIWSKIANYTDYSADDLKKKLSLIINRRNKIAHESDIDYVTGIKNVIDRDMLIDVISFIQKFVEGLESLS